jgi:hypothetical protein
MSNELAEEWVIQEMTEQLLADMEGIPVSIFVTRENADDVYGACRAVLGYNKSLSGKDRKKISEAKERAHQFLYEEANDPNTSIERKIALVKLTSRNTEQ